MDNLSDLLSGVQISNQHPYFELAKKDIYKLALQYANYKDYDSSGLYLNKEGNDLYNLNIVIQYIITYGNQLFRMYLQDMKVDSYNKIDCEQYITEYVEELSNKIEN